MAMMRAAEERGLGLYKQGKVPGSFYDGCGQEAISVGAAYAMAPRDRLCILHRDLGAHFVRGVTPDRYLANYMGRAGGVTGGKDGNMHFGERSLGCIGMVSMLPDMALVATGLALAFKMRSEPRVALTFFGEGSTANGQWHEAMNFAGIHRLPAVFILENNQFAYSTPNRLEFVNDPLEHARAYGFPGVRVDGNAVEEVFEATHAAAERARAGEGPTLIEAVTMRMHGHGAHDDMSYVPDGMREEWARRDPIDNYARRLAEQHGFDSAELDSIREEVRAYVAECAEKALASPMPDPDEATRGVFADRWEPLGDGEAPWSRWAEDAAGRNGHETPSGGNGHANGGGGRLPATGRAA
jgi:pyruvate dehydrogenase E1 component alpha subunit